MGFEVVPTYYRSTDKPRISIHASGNLYLNKAAIDLANLCDTEYVTLLYDSQKRKLAICPTESEKTFGARSCHWRHGANNGVEIGAKAFLNQVLGKRPHCLYVYDVEYDKAADMIIFELPQKLRG